MEVTLVAAVIAAIALFLSNWITFYLTRSHYEQKRRDELDDRDYLRRVEVHDKKIQDARDFVDKYESIIDEVYRYTRRFKGVFIIADAENKRKELRNLERLKSDITVLRKEAHKKFNGVLFLGDARLLEYSSALLTLASKTVQDTQQLLQNLLIGTINKGNELDAIEKTTQEANRLTRLMQKRLDEMFQEAK
jgi:hypothetical protein